MLIKIWIVYDSDETEIRLPFYRSFPALYNIFGGFLSMDMGKRWCKVICCEIKSPKFKKKIAHRH